MVSYGRMKEWVWVLEKVYHFFRLWIFLRWLSLFHRKMELSMTAIQIRACSSMSEYFPDWFTFLDESFWKCFLQSFWHPCAQGIIPSSGLVQWLKQISILHLPRKQARMWQSGVPIQLKFPVQVIWHSIRWTVFGTGCNSWCVDVLQLYI